MRPRNIKGKKVLITRQFEQSGSFVNALSRKGHFPFLLPMIETVQLCPVIDEGSYEVILFTSANAVKYFAPYKDYVRGYSYIAVGPKTAMAMEAFLNVSANMIPMVYDMASALKMIYSIPLRNARILAPGAVERTPMPVEDLESMGAEVIMPAVYETNFAEYPDEYIETFLHNNAIDTLTFCSPSAAKSFFKQFKGDISQFDIVSIGTTTAIYLDKLNIESRYPQEFTVEAMVDII